MLKILMFISVITSSCGAYASNPDWVVYDWDLELALSRIPSRLLVADHPFSKEDLLPIFNELDKMKPRTARKSNASEDSADSGDSLNSVSSQESVEAIEEAIQVCFEGNLPTALQLQNRQTFINALHSLETEIDPVVFQKGIELIANQLIG